VTVSSSIIVKNKIISSQRNLIFCIQSLVSNNRHCSLLCTFFTSTLFSTFTFIFSLSILFVFYFIISYSTLFLSTTQISTWWVGGWEGGKDKHRVYEYERGTNDVDDDVLFNEKGRQGTITTQQSNT
jgi:hypothetical protein